MTQRLCTPWLLALPAIALGCDPEPAAHEIPRLEVETRGALVQCARGTFPADPSWIDQMIGGDDSDDCTALVMDGWHYARCW